MKKLVFAFIFALEALVLMLIMMKKGSILLMNLKLIQKTMWNQIIHLMTKLNTLLK